MTSPHWPRSSRVPKMRQIAEANKFELVPSMKSAHWALTDEKGEIRYWHEMDGERPLGARYQRQSRHHQNVPECRLVMLWTAPALRHRSAIGWLPFRRMDHVSRIAGAYRPVAR
jgi:hypothetical protein